MDEHLEGGPADDGSARDLYEQIAELSEAVSLLQSRLEQSEARNAELASRIERLEDPRRPLRCSLIQVIDEFGGVCAEISTGEERVQMVFWKPGTSRDPRLRVFADIDGACGISLLDGADTESACLVRDRAGETSVHLRTPSGAAEIGLRAGADGTAEARIGATGGAAIEAQASPAGVDAAVTDSSGTSRIILHAAGPEDEAALHLLDARSSRVILRTGGADGSDAEVGVLAGTGSNAASLWAEAGYAAISIGPDEPRITAAFEEGVEASVRIADERGAPRVVATHDEATRELRIELLDPEGAVRDRLVMPRGETLPDSSAEGRSDGPPPGRTGHG